MLIKFSLLSNLLESKTLRQQLPTTRLSFSHFFLSFNSEVQNLTERSTSASFYIPAIGLGKDTTSHSNIHVRQHLKYLKIFSMQRIDKRPLLPEIEHAWRMTGWFQWTDGRKLHTKTKPLVSKIYVKLRDENKREIFQRQACSM